MINPVSVTEVERPEIPSFHVDSPEGPASPLVFGSPHSGRIYPDSFMAATALSEREIRGSEDAYVDQLIAGAPKCGIPVINARFARAFFDVNREPWELDPLMFEDELPSFARGRGPRVAAGLGAIARIVREGQEIYDRKLTFAEAEERVAMVHGPYHQALSDLLHRARAANGQAILLDWHSMPAEAAALSCAGRTADIVLGDRFGAACAPAIVRRIERELTALGYRVVRNTPYAGGYTTEHYGKPHHRTHALQLEINRSLYLERDGPVPSRAFAALKANLDRLFKALAAVDWTAP